MMHPHAATSGHSQLRTTTDAAAPIVSPYIVTVLHVQHAATDMATSQSLSSASASSSSLPSTHQPTTNAAVSASSAASSSSVLAAQSKSESKSESESESSQNGNRQRDGGNDDRMDDANERMYDDDPCGGRDGDGLGAIVCRYAVSWSDSDADADRILADDVAASPSSAASGEAVSPPPSSTHTASSVDPSSLQGHRTVIDLCSDSDSDAETGRKEAHQRRSDDGECLKEEKKDGEGESTVDGDAASTSAIPSTSAETTVGRTPSLPHTSFAIDPGEHDTEGKEEEQKKRQKDGDGDAMQIDDAGTDDHPAAYPSAITPSASASAAAAAAGVSASSSSSSTPHQSCSASSNLLVHVPASPPMDAAAVDTAQTMKEISALHACCIYCARLEEMEVAEEAGSGWVSVSKLGRSEYVNHIHSAVRYRSRILINTGPPLSHCTHPAHHLCPDHAAAPPVMRSLRSSDAAGDPLAVESASVAMGTKTREQVKDSLAAMPHSQATSHSFHCGSVSPHCHSSLDGNGSAEQCFVSPPRGAVDAATPLSSTALSPHRTSNAAHTPATTNAPTHSTASVVSMPHSSSLTTAAASSSSLSSSSPSVSTSHQTSDEPVGHGEEHKEKKVSEDEENEDETEDGGRMAQPSSSSSRGPPSPHCIFCGQFFRKSKDVRDHMLRFHTRAIPCLRCDLCFHSYAVRRKHYKGVHQCDVPAEQRDQPMIEYRKLPEVKAILDQFNGDMRAAGLAAAKARAGKKKKEDEHESAHRSRRFTSSIFNRKRKHDTDEDEPDHYDNEYAAPRASSSSSSSIISISISISISSSSIAPCKRCNSYSCNYQRTCPFDYI